MDEQVARDWLEENGYLIAKSPYARFIGERIAIYGPNYIWTGELESISECGALTLVDVYEIDETGPHSETGSTKEKIGDVQVFERSAICNAGPTKWA